MCCCWCRLCYLQANLQDTIDKLATALGEGNLYGALYTMQHAASKGLQAGGQLGWPQPKGGP